MLVLSRKIGERIRIGDDIWVSIQGVANGKIRVGIEAPKEIQIAREEVAVETIWGPVDLDGKE